ncbi:helix-turn-helix transcriptional regulator [Microbacterium sp. SORGH_AS_0888]|uniref:helix-turn-helix domain-containing protein n=1 Tax=Microbacterium sp. SORGH_AS_0888 TaxID=3041791 RepID=UPI002783D745|nr:helix-turn-helix transcriptional regulator [Microbacterium sp. SORGH_AS_0888]MDQ1131249.1 putative transcriptional regulator [Microbacterium sp. SORGH_AS_0888]
MPSVGVSDRYVHCRLTELLDQRGMSLTELSDRVGVTIANLSILKNDRAKAIRFTTLAAICDVLDCEVGELFVILPGSPPAPRARRGRRSP